jgi:hypothetical protein
MILGQFNMLKKNKLDIENIYGGGRGKNKNKILFHFCEFSERAWEMPQNKFLFLFSFCSFPERRARETSNNKSLALHRVNMNNEQ